MRPTGLLFDYGGTLVEEVGADLRAGHEWLLSRAAHRPPNVTLDGVIARAARIARDVSGRREVIHVETPWPAVTRLIHDPLGVRFDEPMADLEIGFWKAAIRNRPMPGAVEALARFASAGMPMAVVSNISFGAPVLRDELDRHGLAHHLEFVIASSEYSVRKPNPLLFEIAAARLGVEAKEIWFVGDRVDTDVRGAKAAGMTAVWFRRDGTHVAEAGEPDLIVSSWEELVHRIEAESAREAGAGPVKEPRACS
jgi:putative hydrolase of the HAD superfamily